MREAEIRAAMILERVELAQERPRTVQISHYPTEEDFERIVGSDSGWTWEDHCQVNEAVVRILKRHGIKVRLVAVKAEDFFGWLKANGLPNTTANRAQFVAVAAEQKEED